MRGEKGFALVIALVVTTLLVALLVEFVNEVYVDTSHSHNFVAAQQASLLAESGAQGGMELLKQSNLMKGADKGKYTSPLELWGQPRSFEVDNGTVSIVIEEESGKIDLNSATSLTGTPPLFSHNALLRLFDNLKLSRDLYEALADWVDTDETPRPNGAEANYYRTLKPPHLVHNNWLDSVEELALIRGFTPEVVAKLRPFVTVYGSANGIPAKININTAPKEVLASLHDDMMKGGKVEEVLEYRKTKVIKNLPDVFGNSSLTNELALNVNCAGSIYRIHAEGKVGETVSIVEAVVTDVDTLNPRVLYWRQY